MVTSSNTEELVRQLHDRAVRELVASHRVRTDQPLVLAVRFDLTNPADIHLLEVLDSFPGGDDDELLTTDFEPSAQLRILGKLYLTLGSPAQLESAVRRGDAMLARIRAGTVLHDDGTQRATQLRKLLGL